MNGPYSEKLSTLCGIIFTKQEKMGKNGIDVLMGKNGIETKQETCLVVL